MNRIHCETDFGHRDPGPTVFGDLRVSAAEQQDRMPPVAGEPAAWMVVAIGLSPLIAVAVMAAVTLFFYY